MPEQILQQKIFPYDGGQDSTKNPILISPKDVVDSNNIYYTTYSTKRKRPGIRYATTPKIGGGNPILGCYDFWRLGQQRIVWYDGRRLYAVNPNTGVKDDITGNHTLPVNETITFVAFQGLLIIFFGGGETNIKYWTMAGTIQDLNPVLPKAPFGRVWLNSLWIPDISIPGRMLKSKTNDPTDFAGGDAQNLDLDVNDGDPDGITAVFPPFFKNLYVAKRLAVYKIEPFYLTDGSLRFAPNKISDGIGCISHNAVVAAAKNIFFPSDEGLHTFETTDKISEIDTDLISRDIQPVWTSDTNFNRARFMQSVYDKALNSIITLFPAASYNFPTDVWGFSLVAKKWYRWRDFNHVSLCRYVEISSKRLRTLCGSDSGDLGILDEDVKSDYGVRYGCSIQSGLILPQGSPDGNFGFTHIGPLFVPQIDGKFTISHKVDGRTIDTTEFSMKDTSLGDELGVNFVTGVSVLGGIPQIKLDTRAIRGYGMVYQLFIEHEQTDNDDEDLDFEILGVFVDVTPVMRSTGERVA